MMRVILGLTFLLLVAPAAAQSPALDSARQAGASRLGAVLE